MTRECPEKNLIVLAFCQADQVGKAATHCVACVPASLFLWVKADNLTTEGLTKCYVARWKDSFSPGLLG